MSRSGVLSGRGDYYQILIAKHWLIRLLRNPAEISFVQAESTGIPGEPDQVTVDDIVVRFADGRTRYIQAKKNQPDFRSWSLSQLKEELLKAIAQLEGAADAEVQFVSRSSFGDLQKLTEECTAYQDYEHFETQAPSLQKKLIEQFSVLVDRSTRSAFQIVKRFHFGSSESYEDWEARNLADLRLVVPRAETADAVFDSLLLKHQTKLRATTSVFTYADVKHVLAQHSLDPTPFRTEAELASTFRQSSAIGRTWQRDVAGETIARNCVSEALDAITAGKKTIIVMGGPGAGKTCVLLDIADAVEQRPELALLFIKADLFKSLSSEEDLAAAGLPTDIVGHCARFSEYRQIVVVIDSLDVLSLTRHHQSLKLFLRLLDRLEKLENTTIIAACREFDLKYDPALRVRVWDQTVQVGLLDFESHVSPVLEKLGLVPNQIPAVARDLLRIPNHLKLYAELALRRGIHAIVTSMYDLFELFIEELILKNDELGPSVIGALYEMAAYQLEERSSSTSRARFAAPSGIAPLLSLGVLIEPTVGRLQFGHQTWIDVLSVRKALSIGQTMQMFIKSHKPFPFIRPSVRAFFLYLRAQQPDTFRREVRAVLADPDIAYHFKRLIAESLADIVPDTNDWGLIRHLIDNHPDLFRRFAWRVESAQWFLFLRQHWLNLALGPAHSTESNEELLTFLARLSYWMNDFPAEVIAIWRKALDDRIDGSRRLRWQVIVALKDFHKWSAEGAYDLLNELMDARVTKDRDLLGHAISRFVDATQSGDELLWNWITCDVQVARFPGLRRHGDLHCLPHDLCSESFLKDRICDSEYLLELILASVTRWSREATSDLDTRTVHNVFLHDTSWERSHTDVQSRPAESGVFLFDALELALRKHSADNSAWWCQHADELRSSPELALRYLYIRAAEDNVIANVESITAALSDSELLNGGDLDHELGRLLNAACPYLPADVVEETQRLILRQCAGDLSESSSLLRRSITHRACRWLDWIPCCFRLAESQALLDGHADSLFPICRTPSVYMSGGMVQSPVSPEELLSLSDVGLLKLLNHYCGPGSHDEFGLGRLTGGTSEVLQQLRNAATLHPARMLKLLRLLVTDVSDLRFAEGVVMGVAYHIEFRNGQMSKPQQWNPWSEPELEDLARSLVRSVELLPPEQRTSRDVAEALLACSRTLLRPDDVELLIALLLNASTSGDPQAGSEEAGDLIMIAINSVRGRVANAALILCDRLLDLAVPLPGILMNLLHRLSTDEAVAVRALVLTSIAYTQIKAPEVGWSLFRQTLAPLDSRLWAYTERCFYHQYHNHYDAVAPWLERMEIEAPNDADAGWARIITLACLSQHIDFPTLVTKLERKGSMPAWQGAIQIFVANLDRRETTSACQHALLHLLRNAPQDKELVGEIEHMFAEGKFSYITDEIAVAYLESLKTVVGHLDLYGFLQWLEVAALRNPRAAMIAAETMTTFLINRKEPTQIWNKEPLLAALTMMLREADESDDIAFITRAISLQDQLLRLDVYGIEELYDAAGRA